MTNINDELNEIFNDPLLDLSDKELSLFNFPADMKRSMQQRKEADYVAGYSPCKDFAKYAPLFKKVHQELKEGKRSLQKVVSTSNFQADRFYVVNGVMLLLDKLEIETLKGSNGLPNGRTHCVLENGQETDILLQTLRKNVVSGGFGVTELDEEMQQDYFAQKQEITAKDKVTGYIYVLSTKSENPDLLKIKNLYKIGFTTQTVEERVADAENDPTYLMAGVDIVATYNIANMSSHKFESLLHQVLGGVQMNITVTDRNGGRHHPKEWFSVPLAVIDSIIQKIVVGTIVNYRYNAEQECLEKISAARKKQSGDGAKADASSLKAAMLARHGLKDSEVLYLPIKKVYFDEILAGTKTQEFREIKASTMRRLVEVDKDGHIVFDDEGYAIPIQYKALYLAVGYSADRDTALVEVTEAISDYIYDENHQPMAIDIDGHTIHPQLVVFNLGKVLEVRRKGETGQ